MVSIVDALYLKEEDEEEKKHFKLFSSSEGDSSGLKSMGFVDLKPEGGMLVLELGWFISSVSIRKHKDVIY